MNPRLKRIHNFWSDIMKKMASYLWGFWIKTPKISNRNLLTKLIEFQTVPCHSFLFVHVLKNITSWFNPFPSVPFDSFSFRTNLNTNYLRFIPFLFVPFHFLALLQTVYSPSTRCLYFCLLFRITVNYAELGINLHTSPKNIRSQKWSLPHNISK